MPLNANGTPFTFRPVEPDHPDNVAFVSGAHPAGKFPVLVDGETTVIEATAIVEYLAVHHPGSAPLIPDDPPEAVTARMLDRVFDNYVMANMNRVVWAHIADGANPDLSEIDGGKAGLQRAYAWLEGWLAHNRLAPHVSLVSCAAAPALFYADWVAPIGSDFPRLAALRAELLALPAVARCVEDARPYRGLFPPGAPDRD
ncbi:glutathione S-transferase family protein [Altererythrobacter aerius]|uniref:Glutathione S-transferase family protein n=1 Tax=Tsuneonella aeria TaxID=1837929 RepID=A0A6I4TFD8_9SPHN|nr:glutathione S-transferase family protein [Tsuneonella aeria]